MRVKAFVAAAVLAASGSAFAAGAAAAGSALLPGIPTADRTAAANFVRQMAEMARAYEMARANAMSTEAILRGAIGNRNFGLLLSHPAIAQSIPADIRSIVYAAQGRSFRGMAGPLERILREEQIASNPQVARREILARERHVAAAEKALAESAYPGAEARRADIERLRAQILRTQDQKGIEELQARIALYHAEAQVDSMRLGLIRQQQDAERELLRGQRRQVVASIYDPSIMDMPSLR